jgi:serine/threonine protein kinase/Tol biopolymer transport system component
MVGQTISHYKVLEQIGHGGMGAVYKATDTLLDRVLAIKVLRPDISNPTRERRFIQEAKTASSLNHPNIVTIYEIFHIDNSPCIAMEYVSGETLERHLEKGPLDRETALDWAIPIADALARAHAAGIVHRDVKPGNVMITDDGLVKILDFGLAKLMEVSNDSNPGERLTMDDRIVGSPPYLSPEQARAERIDARSDIFSLGAVLYEMFTGKRPFERPSNVEMLAAVVQDKPKKPRSLTKHLPAALEQIILRCLEKEVDRRFQRMEDVRDALEAVRNSESLARLLAARTPQGTRPRWWIWLSAVLLIVVLAGGLLLWMAARRNATPARSAVLTRITYDDGVTTDPAISPDGKFLAYASDRGGETLDIWIKPVTGGQDVRLTNHPADDGEPAFSPDGYQVVFRSERDGGGVYAKSILGGDARLIVRNGRRPRFSPDGKWIAYWTGFSTGDPTSPGSNQIFIIPSSGGSPRQLATDFQSALYPVWSPDSKHVLFLGAHDAPPSRGTVLAGSNRPVDRTDWWVAPIDGSRPIKTGASNDLRKQGLSVWASSGAGIAPDVWLSGRNEVVFSASLAGTDTFRDSLNLWTVPLSPKLLRIEGPARPLTSGTDFESSPTGTPSGEIIYFGSAQTRTGVWMLPLSADEGKVTGDLGQLTRGTAFHGQPCVALDGSKVVYFVTRSGNMDLWTLDLQTRQEAPLTSSASIDEFSPQISADGGTVFFSLYGTREAYSMSSRGGEATKLCDDCGTWSISHDGQKLLYWYSTTNPVVSVGMLEIPAARKVELIRHPEYSLYQPHFSPDDRWIAFLAKTGQDRSRIYVTPFRGAVVHPSSEWIPITDGESLDDKPRWSPDGNLIYFTSEQDGFRCVRAQRLDGATKRPVGDPFYVHHFHASRRSLKNVGLGPLEISVSRSGLVFNLGEITSNIWQAAR